ncbi:MULTISPECIES: glycoside hydrolase family 43 protein [unclassified Leeuwenhoekiella]|uniref:glycoside hydrolase family 43 protein n=1 Tax=unclassified Leeuwenhoekiella TaxID=2615029 RepID=UPI000C526D79|nr:MULTISPECIES: glycoside hydrolase family 43 protein [unclassified Leeuwenhoekiella]MAW94683.1 beta-glucanase [Leeuwenhoekiella sp.]MBA82106.1 beta-glucanase [Leeuwenhoekiella sp.]|tara:strand:+ start:25145 stop:26305 length:1161 start_codon:yes stop_codon:yes gene_type:complete
MYISNVFLLILIFASSAGVQAQLSVKKESFLPGKVWYDVDGDTINAHGGGFYYQDGIYYWYGEHKSRNSLAEVGVRVYSSKDLLNWKNEGVALAVSTDASSEITSGSVIERPKVIYNKKTRKYVLWFHLELKDRGYEAARTGVAVSDSPVGPFEYVKSYRPNAGVWPQNFSEHQKTKENATELRYEWWTGEWGKALEDGLYVRRDFEEGQMSRDMTVFVDDDNKAYHIHSSEENQTLHISLLTDDYLDFTDTWVRVQPGGQNEAPAVFKSGDYYYMVTSGLTGWDPNAARSFRAKSMLGPWESLGNPAKGKDADVTFNSQSTFILPVEGRKDTFIFMADRWNPKNHKDGRYVWLPLAIKNNSPEIKWIDEWNLNERRYVRQTESEK